MDISRSNAFDTAIEKLHVLGHSHGYTASHGVLTKTWIFYAHKAEHRIATYAATLADADRDAVEQAS